MTSSLGFKMIVASFLVVSVFIFVAGLTVIKISQDAIKEGVGRMVGDMADDLMLMAPKEVTKDVTDKLLARKIKKSGSVWLMDKDGYLLFHPDPVYQKEYMDAHKELGNVVVSLQVAEPRHQIGKEGSREKLKDIIAKYDRGYGTYQQFGETRVIAFRVMKEQGWLLGLDEPQATAESELTRIRKYITYTGLISAVLILLFTWLAIRIIVKPYYREVEELNERLKSANTGLTDANRMLEVSNRKITGLYRISITMQETLALQDILELIVSGAQEVLGVDRINLMLPDRGEKELRCRAAIGAGDSRIESISVPVGSKGGAIAAAFKRGQMIRIGDTDQVPPHFRLSPPQSEEPFLRSSHFVILPMVVKNRTVGVIAVDNKVSRQPVTDDMVNLLQIYANQAAVAVENARLYEEVKRSLDELEQKVDQLSIVNQISNRMQSMVKKREMLGFILRGIKESMGYDSLAVMVIDHEEEVIRGEAGVGLPEEKVLGTSVSAAEDESIVATVAARGVPATFATTATDSLIEAIQMAPGNAALREGAALPPGDTKLTMALVPFRVLDRVAGLLALAKTRQNKGIPKKDMEFLMLFANNVGLAVERADLYLKAQEDAENMEITDHVSRLFTFKYGQQRSREELLRARESQRPLSVMMVGVDNFKEYNELCGQELGDRALREIAHKLTLVIDGHDVAFRQGGRLLCCLLPGKRLVEAGAVAEKLRAMVADHLFNGCEGAADQRLTLSVGVYELVDPAGLDAPGELFKRAMGLLHRAEGQGGNQVVTS